MDRMTDGEDTFLISSLMSEIKKEEVTKRILKALGDYMDKNPDGRRDFLPVTDSLGNVVVPQGSNVFYARLAPEGPERETVFIYTV
ncbi:MAG: hypothetical protein LBS53_07435 [Synergistaceae bacterium]|jgi:hypothetical protein|nr:hypothetical protein [Synergistaceae bacterium]